MTWHHAADLAALDGREVLGVTVAGQPVALSRLDGAVYATADRCTHGQACLSAGEVVEGYIECPLHFGLFDIRTGKAGGAPVSRDLDIYPVRLEGHAVLVDID